MTIEKVTILTAFIGMNNMGKNRKLKSAADTATTDIVSPEKRSEMMSKVRSKDSVAEKKVRSALHAAGYRFRLHRKDLPGIPAIVFPRSICHYCSFMFLAQPTSLL
jgi:hypothetical protein